MKRAGNAQGDTDALAARWLARRDAGLTEREQVEFARWHAESPRHAEAFSRHERIWQALGRPRRTGAGERLQEELVSRLHTRRRRRVGTAAALAAVLALGGLTWRTLPPATFLDTSGPARHTAVLTPERRTLPDGTVMENAPGARWQVEYSPAERRINLQQGKTHFEVVKDSARPFVVAAGGVEIRAVGTAFLVQYGHSQLEVLVTEGKIAVEKAGGEPRQERTTSPTYVEAGQRVRMEVAAQPAAAPAVEPVPPADLADRLAWRTTRVEFSGAPLAEVVAVLNRYQETKYVLGDPALASVPLSGLFRADDPEVFTALLRSGFGIAAERRGSEWVLRRDP